MYKQLIQPILFRLDAEYSHRIIFSLGKLSLKLGLVRLISKFFSYPHPSLKRNFYGINFSNPIGLAAGFDKNAELVDFWESLGFGFIEVGTITPRPQNGNPKPRLFRLTEDKALINRMGFNNHGVDKIARRLKARKKSSMVIGANIGKNKDTPNKKAVEDYEICFKKLHNLVDFITVNVSSPNTPNLRDLQDRSSLMEILGRLQDLNKSNIPIFLKISPDLTGSQIDDLIEVVEKTKTAGVVAVNTTTSREGLVSSKEKIASAGGGGLSGLPLRGKSDQLVFYLHERLKGKILIIGAGGIFSSKDALDRMRVGASLVEIYTGLVYEGPGLIKSIARGIVKIQVNYNSKD